MPVAQLDRVSASEAEGYGSDSHQAHETVAILLSSALPVKIRLPIELVKKAQNFWAFFYASAACKISKKCNGQHDVKQMRKRERKRKRKRRRRRNMSFTFTTTFTFTMFKIIFTISVIVFIRVKSV